MSRYPELEMRMKLLYTAITRCRHRLFFVETQSSSAGEAFVRWILGTKLAEKQDIADLTVRLKSPDEWKSLGVEYALNAESQETADDAKAWFERAEVCFQRGGDKKLASRARAHSTIRVRAGEHHGLDWNEIRDSTPELLELCFSEGVFFTEEAIHLCETALDYCPADNKKFETIVEAVLVDMHKAADVEHTLQ